MQRGAPALVMEFDTGAVSFDQFVDVRLTNTGQDDTFAFVTLTPTLGNFGDTQEVTLELAPGESTEITLNAINSKGGDACWLSIRSESDQVVPTAFFWNFNNEVVAAYLPGDFAIFNLLGGKTRLG